ncbi:MAG: riboflavin synthase [Gammaproteobacteria bacterium]
MFTGIVNHCGEVIDILTGYNSAFITISSDFENLELGESISINGICLTVAKIEGNCFSCDVSPETMRLTNAGFFKKGSKVNLERALQLSDRLGGHFVLGHVDRTCQLSQRKSVNEYVELSFTGIPDNEMHYFVKKGSVCVNGVSLTINAVIPNGFQVMLIPHTLLMTNLENLKTGDSINIEYDYLAKLVENHAAKMDLRV